MNRIEDPKKRGPIFRSYIFLCCINFDGDSEKFMMIMDGVLMSIPCSECHGHFQEYLNNTTQEFKTPEDCIIWAFNLRNKIKERQGMPLQSMKELDAYLNQLVY